MLLLLWLRFDSVSDAGVFGLRRYEQTTVRDRIQRDSTRSLILANMSSNAAEEAYDVLTLLITTVTTTFVGPLPFHRWFGWFAR